MQTWVPTPTFLYRNYLYKKIIKKDFGKSNILLIGTGNGYFAHWLSVNGYNGLAIDISQEAVRFTKEVLKKRKNILIKKADLFKFSVKRKYDIILCFEVIEHIKKDKEAIAKIYDLLSPGGSFLMSVPAHMSEWAKIDEIGGHFRRYEKKELITKMKKAGFGIDYIWSYGFPFLRVVRWISRSGKFVKDFEYDKQIGKRTKKSGLRVEYDPKFKGLVTNNIFLDPMFKIMDLFLMTDWGLGYIVKATKPSI